MTINFFSKCSKFDIDSTNGRKKSEKVFGYQDNCIWIGDYQFSQSRKRLLVLVMKKSDESALMQIFQEFGTLLHVDSQGAFWSSVLWKFSHADFTRVWKSLTCWLSKAVLKQCFLESGLTKFLTVCNFQNKVPMKIIFFLKNSNIWCRFQKWNKRITKIFWF